MPGSPKDNTEGNLLSPSLCPSCCLLTREADFGPRRAHRTSVRGHVVTWGVSRRPNPLPSWHERDRVAYVDLVRRATGIPAAKAQQIVDAYPKGSGLRAAQPGELRHLGLTASEADRLHHVFALCRYVSEEVHSRDIQILNTRDITRYLGSHMGHLDQELLVLVMLDSRRRVIDTREIGLGELSQVAVHPREVFREAVRLPADSIILAHNHPSGDAAPSRADIELTHQLVEMGAMLGIPLRDHVVVGRGPGGELAVTSLADLGYI